MISEHEYLSCRAIGSVDYLNEKYPVLELPEAIIRTLSGLIVKSEETIPNKVQKLLLDCKIYSGER